MISIARQSFTDPATSAARRSFESRLQGLAQTHARLAEANWSGVSLATILGDEFRPYRRSDGGNVRLGGPTISLAPRCALTLGMALHELVTNAAKYGALSNRTGSVSVTWTVEDNTLHIDWQEEGGPEVAPPTRRGFGRLLLERALTSDLKSVVQMDFRKEGLRCSIEIPEPNCVTTWS